MLQRREDGPEKPTQAAALEIRLKPFGEFKIGVPKESAPQLLQLVGLGVSMAGPGFTLWAGSVGQSPVWLFATIASAQLGIGVASFVINTRALRVRR